MGKKNPPGNRSGRRRRKRKPPPPQAGVKGKRRKKVCCGNGSVVFVRLYRLTSTFIFQNIEQVKTTTDPSSSERPPTASERKISAEKVEIPAERENWSGHRIIDIDLVFGALTEVLACKTCAGKVKIGESCVRGHTSIFDVTCENCGILKKTKNCAKVENAVKSFELNRRVVYASRSAGIGRQSLETFCALMDLPPTLAKHSFDSTMKVCILYC